MGKGEETRRAIIDEALELASTVGLEKLTIGALAGTTGMSKSGLFAHFRSKEQLQLQVDPSVGAGDCGDVTVAPAPDRCLKNEITQILPPSLASSFFSEATLLWCSKWR